MNYINCMNVLQNCTGHIVSPPPSCLWHSSALYRIFRETEWGFNNYTEYRPGDMNLIITAPHGGTKRPSAQLSNGENWPNRENGCVGLDGRCRYTHDCTETTTACKVLTFNDFKTLTIAQDIADGIKAITGQGFTINLKIV